MKTALTTVRTQLVHRQVARLAEATGLLEAQRWFARERLWINEQHLAVCRIPAPTFFEKQRAEWLRSQFEMLGWNATLDRAGNVIASRPNLEPKQTLLVSAHLDTVFAPSRAEEVYFAPDGRLIGPGVSDNGSGLTALLALARVLVEAPELRNVAEATLLVANVGEEGEGNLSGMRFICRNNPQLAKVKAFLVLDGPSTDHITALALASRRFEIAFSGPGGHSWNDSGTPNPVHALGEVISVFLKNAEGLSSSDRRSRCSYSFGVVEGGTSINSIPAEARAKLDLRSEDTNLLDELAGAITAAVEKGLERENRRSRTNRLNAKVKELGSRPGGRLSPESPLLNVIQSVDAYLGIRSKLDCASTDANVPLSMGLPAISIGSGGQGGGAHTRQEWYHPDGREVGLQRILLALAALEAEASTPFA